ncbi:MAG: hypothetical protein GC192_09605 [Bacteroidetes bacterium]|nr:hypothetical protein [Bacteroidota bacterium]
MKKDIKRVIIGVLIIIISGVIMYYFTKPDGKEKTETDSTTNKSESNTLVNESQNVVQMENSNGNTVNQIVQNTYNNTYNLEPEKNVNSNNIGVRASKNCEVIVNGEMIGAKLSLEVNGNLLEDYGTITRTSQHFFFNFPNEVCYVVLRKGELTWKVIIRPDFVGDSIIFSSKNIETK